VSRGVYRFAEASPPPHLDLLTVALRVPRAVIGLVSALAFHGISDEIAHEVTLALPRGAARPRLDHAPTRVFTFSGRGYSLGIEHHELEGVDLKVYGVTKTIVDCFRVRNRLGVDIAVKALARALETRKARPAELVEVAKALRMQHVMAPYLEALS
jgi:predicted transcriptional regulator of viral defense system